MDTTNATELIRTYFDAAVATDQERYVALFAADAVVEDDGRTLAGREAVREWRSGVPAVSYGVGDVRADDGGWSVPVTVAGDFPGSPVDLRFWFRFSADGLVAALRIRP